MDIDWSGGLLARLRSLASRAALVCLATLAFVGCVGDGEPTASTIASPADLVLRGGSIYTVDAVRSWARALAVRDGRIVYVGTEPGAAPYVGAGTRVLELGGRTVMPSFQDVHVHPVGSGTVAARFCDLSEASSLEEYLAVVVKYSAERPEVEWIQGSGWYMDEFPGGVPDKQSLDEIVPDRPVFLSSGDGHSAWVNSKALEVAGITKDTPDPPDGRIDRDPVTGEAVGALQEGAMELVQPPTFTTDDLDAGLRYALKMLHGYGVTAFQEAWATRQELETYRRLDESGELSAHVVAALWWQRDRGEEQIPELVAERERFTAGNLRATTVKIMQDGVMENQTAALLEPYLGESGGRGISFVEPEALKKIVTRLDDEGFQVHFHAIGDAAIRHSLDAVEAARERNGDNANRHHISHIQLFDPADIGRFRELGVVANFQPLWAYADPYITELTIPFLGAERSRWLYPIGSLVKSGAIVAFGSDWSVSSANPFEEMEVAVTRMDPDGGAGSPFLPDERIDLATALAAFTINAAYVNGIDDMTGSLEVGKLADLIVVDRNPFEVPAAEISEIEVLLTLFAGKPVHGTLLQ